MRPSLFIGSSSEGIAIAQAIQRNLDNSCEVEIWSQGTFGLSGGTLQSLLLVANRFDFAVLVLTPDDLVESRGICMSASRDNVLFELGLFMGSLGPERTFVVFDRSSNLKLPSDLAGVTMATYQPHRSGNLSAALGRASSEIEQAVKRCGHRVYNNPSEKNDFEISTDELLCQYDWYNEIGYKNATELKKGVSVLFEENAMFPEIDEEYYRRLQRIRIPENPYEVSPRGFVKISQSDSEWIDPRNRRRRIHDTTISEVLSPTEVSFGSGFGVGIQCIVDVLQKPLSDAI
jgi:Predicted nucleotide-binding protein containing TIR-like domain